MPSRSVKCGLYAIGAPATSGSSVFDCPAQNQTSPTSTSFTSTSLALRTRFSDEASIAGSFTIHFPSAPAVVLTVLPPKETDTFSPASAQPQTGTSMPRCRTILSLNGVASSTFACAVIAAAAAIAANPMLVFMLISFRS